MRVLLVLISCLMLSPSALGGGGAGWEAMDTRAGVVVERKTMPGSALFAFRGEGEFEAPIGLLVKVLKEPSIATEWVDMMTEHTVIRKTGENKKLIYESYGLPWPISDRDYVMVETCGYDDDKKIFTIDYESVEDAAKPGRSDHVRAMAFRTFWRLEKIDAGHTKVEVEVFTDPKGILPAWAINMIQKDWPWKTIDGLVKRANQGDLAPDAMVADW